jgi:hypothetical protein
MNKKLTPEQVNKLFRFCHRHYVYQYDLQVELVDHLASSIEEQWKENPDITFEKALHDTFKKFGVTGFSKVKVEKEKELTRKYNRLLWKYFVEFYRWPKMLMTLAFTLLLLTLFKLSDNYFWVLIPYFSALSLGIIYYYYKIFPAKYKIKTSPGKSFMLLQQLKNVQYFAVFAVQIPLHIFNFWNILNHKHMDNPVGLFLASLVIVSFTIALCGQLFYVPQKIKEHFYKQYAEFAL